MDLAIWQKVLLVISALFLVMILFRSIRANPQFFKLSNLSKSLTVMGVVAVGLIIFIALLINILQSMHH